MALDTTALSEIDSFDALIYPPKTGTTVLASDVADGENHLANRTKYLNLRKVSKAGDTMTGDLNIDGADLWVTTSGGSGGNITAGGDIEAGGDLTVNGAVNSNLLMSGGNQVKAQVTRTYVRVAELPVFDHAFWSRPVLDQAFYPSRVRSKVLPSATDPAEAVAYGLRVPNEGVLSNVKIALDVVAGHAALPDNMPRVQVVLVDVLAGTFSVLADVSDTTTLPAYEDRHEINVPISPVVVQADRHRVQVIAFGESGANSVVGMVFDLPRFTFDRATIGEE